MTIKSRPEVLAKFETYPPHAREKLYYLRELILATARSIDSIQSVEETLKWGEPSYLTNKGSTIRIDWKAKKPEQYAMYFKCTSRLVPTFRDIYPDEFTYEGNRALVFGLDEAISERELQECIAAALTYHTVKAFPDLGMKKPE